MGDGQPGSVGVRGAEQIILDRRAAGTSASASACIAASARAMARTVFSPCLRPPALDRMPDYVCDPEARVHYDSIGVIQGMRNLPATLRRAGGWAPASTRPSTSCGAMRRARAGASYIARTARKPRSSGEFCPLGRVTNHPLRR